MPRDLTRVAPGITSELIIEDGTAHWRTHNAGRKAYLNWLSELRKNPDALKNLSFAGWTLSFPDVSELDMWKRRIPDLESTDRETRKRAWKWFIASEYADPYRVKERTNKRAIITA